MDQLSNLPPEILDLITDHLGIVDRKSGTQCYRRLGKWWNPRWLVPLSTCNRALNKVVWPKIVKHVKIGVEDLSRVSALGTTSRGYIREIELTRDVRIQGTCEVYTPRPQFLQEVEEFIATCTELEFLGMQNLGASDHFGRSHSHPTVSRARCYADFTIRIHLDLPSLKRLELFVPSPLNLYSGFNRRICFDGDKKPAVRHLELCMGPSSSKEHAFPTALALYLEYCRDLPTLSSIRIKLEYRSDLSWIPKFIGAVEPQTQEVHLDTLTSPWITYNLESDGRLKDDDERVVIRDAVEELHAIITEIKRKSTGGAALRSVKVSHFLPTYWNSTTNTYMWLLKQCIIDETVDFTFYCETTWSEARLRDFVQRFEDKSPSTMREDTRLP